MMRSMILHDFGSNINPADFIIILLLLYLPCGTPSTFYRLLSNGKIWVFLGHLASKLFNLLYYKCTLCNYCFTSDHHHYTLHGATQLSRTPSLSLCPRFSISLCWRTTPTSWSSTRVPEWEGNTDLNPAPLPVSGWSFIPSLNIRHQRADETPTVKHWVQCWRGYLKMHFNDLMVSSL